MNWLICGLSESIEIATNQSAQLRKAEEGKINLCSGRSGFNSLFAKGAGRHY